MKRLLVTAALFGAMSVSALSVKAWAIELPAEIAKRGSIKVALVPNYPPMEFRDPATNALSGFDIDLGEAIGRKLGVKIEWQETSFAEFMPSISTGRVDAILSGFTDYASRHEIASFVDYLRSGPNFFVQQSRAAEFKDLASLCGKKVGASRRTKFPAEIAAWSEKNCGSTPIVFVGTDGSADARTQLKQGRIDAAVQGNETLPYIMDLEPGAYAPVGTPISQQFTGIALPVKEKALQQAILEAVDALIADGTYKTLLAKWKLSDNGIEKATINAGQ
ncbi:ABC transporter substrate-binding protein [Bradyrhizobium sp. SSUT112]|uniref:ABC transporter substrate-binding protein n=1 Tax=Bradyrhizobium sp. SSUT112 TaxID=3040604 RepID=UPI00244A950E|nr:ABC transporter substrate-binding protein [Bradyrhizobium sp. SSUT112]MDH2355050.1 ABC transporter substrate-binding protein [Bradyrhizobium sp. SSUT112]